MRLRLGIYRLHKFTHEKLYFSSTDFLPYWYGNKKFLFQDEEQTVVCYKWGKGESYVVNTNKDNLQRGTGLCDKQLYLYVE